MKKTISKNIGGFMLIASFALVMTSCEKEENGKSNLGDTELQASLKDKHHRPPSSDCAPIPAILNVPEGNELVLKTFARGVQIYEVKRSATNPNVFTWVNIA